MSYYRNVFSIEVLSNDPLPEGMDLESVAYEITDGSCSGMATHALVNQEVSAERMAELLIAQGSDPEFLIDPDEESDEQG